VDIDKLIQLVETEVKKALTDQSGFEGKVNLSKAPSGKKRILALFTGGYTELKEAIVQVERLIQESYAVDAVMSQSAVNVIGQEKIRGISGLGRLICEPAPSISSLELVQESDALVVPILTRNSAVKIALGITDTLVTNIIMQAFISGKPIIAARNSADPDQANCPCIATPDTPPALIMLVKDYLKKLESYGMKLVDVTEIADAMINVLSKDKSGILEQKLITQDIITNLPQGTKQITVAKGSIITPLAKDVAKERGIQIITDHLSSL
jgi:hypothetical protein